MQNIPNLSHQNIKWFHIKPTDSSYHDYHALPNQAVMICKPTLSQALIIPVCVNMDTACTKAAQENLLVHEMTLDGEILVALCVRRPTG